MIWQLWGASGLSQLPLISLRPASSSMQRFGVRQGREAGRSRLFLDSSVWEGVSRRDGKLPAVRDGPAAGGSTGPSQDLAQLFPPHGSCRWRAAAARQVCQRAVARAGVSISLCEHTRICLSAMTAETKQSGVPEAGRVACAGKTRVSGKPGLVIYGCG